MTIDFWNKKKVSTQDLCKKEYLFNGIVSLSSWSMLNSGRKTIGRSAVIGSGNSSRPQKLHRPNENYSTQLKDGADVRTIRQVHWIALKGWTLHLSWVEIFYFYMKTTLTVSIILLIFSENLSCLPMRSTRYAPLDSWLPENQKL